MLLAERQLQRVLDKLVHMLRGNPVFEICLVDA